MAITRYIKRGGKLWIRIFPDKPFTKKPAETRMGKGKGAPERWVAVVKPGRVMFEMSGVDLATATAAMKLAAHKLPILHAVCDPRGEFVMARHVEKMRDLGTPNWKLANANWPSRFSGCGFSSPPAKPKRSPSCAWPEKIGRA